MGSFLEYSAGVHLGVARVARRKQQAWSRDHDHVLLDDGCGWTQGALGI